jgi:D-3-phosphoglycerate dehydrogenase
MAKFRVVTTAGPAPADYGYEMEALAAIDAEIVELPNDEAGFIAGCGSADAFFAKGIRFTDAMIAAAPGCRGIVLGSVGVDNVDVGAATARGIPVTNCPDTFIEEVADHAMTLLLGGLRRIVEQDRMVRQGRWREGRPQLNQYPRLMGSTLGFIAFGHVARAMALRARPFGLRMLGYDPFVKELVLTPYGVEPTTLEDVLRRSDFVSMHAPATAETRGMLTERHFRMMKPTAWLINTGRGATIDEAALITALREGWIAGAALDVLEQEPPRQDNPLLGMDNVILSAHVASASARFDPARRRRVGQELALILGGRWPMSCVNPTVLAASTLRRWQPFSMDHGPNS